MTLLLAAAKLPSTTTTTTGSTTTTTTGSTTTTTTGSTTTTTTSGVIDPLAFATDPEPIYVMPTSAPYNTPSRIVTPTYDGTGEAIHPSVIDFHDKIGANWHGWRYWMAMTPYTDANAYVENPSILVSNNGWYWQVPLGLANPIYFPEPGGSNPVLSDTHIEYDPDTDELVLLYRDNGRDFLHLTARSPDGITWPEASTPITFNLDGHDQSVSPSLCRVAAGDWRMFGMCKDHRNVMMWKAPSPTGPWSGPYTCIDLALGMSSWHPDIRYRDGLFTALVDRGPIGNTDGYITATSVDGLLWRTNRTNFMDISDDGWDTRQLYRAAHYPHENGTHYRVWYSASQLLPAGHPSGNTSEWGIGYVHIPASTWLAPLVAVPGSGSDYADESLLDSPILSWRLGGDPTAPVPEPDISGNGRTGTYHGAYVRQSSISGDAGYSSRLYGGRIYRAHDSGMALSEFTVRAVVSPNSLSSVRTIASCWGPDGGWTLKTNGSSLVYEDSYGTVLSKFSALVGSPLTPVMVGLTVTAGGAVTLFVDGISVLSGTTVLPTTTNTARFAAGGRWTGSVWTDNYTSALEYVDLCPTALSPSRMATVAALVP